MSETLIAADPFERHGWASPPALAAWMHVDPAKVRQWIEAGELSAVNTAARAGGRPTYRVSREAFEQFTERRKAGSKPQAKRTARRNKEPYAMTFF